MPITPIVCYFTRTLDVDIREPILAIASLILSLSILVCLWYVYRFFKGIEERMWAKSHNLNFQYYKKLHDLYIDAYHIVSGEYRGRQIQFYVYSNGLWKKPSKGADDQWSTSVIKIDDKILYPTDFYKDRKKISRRDILRIYDYCIDNNTYEVPKELFKSDYITIIIILLASVFSLALFLSVHIVIFSYFKGIVC